MNFRIMHDGISPGIAHTIRGSKKKRCAKIPPLTQLKTIGDSLSRADSSNE